MKKIFLGGPGNCDVHCEKNMIEMFIDTYYTDYEITKNPNEADIIVITDTCIGTYAYLANSIDYIKNILMNKKKDTQVIVSGCLIKGVKFELTPEQKSILGQVTCIKPDQVAEYVCRIIKPNFDEGLEEISWLDDFSFPYEWARNSISFSIVEGCSNRCSFCKSNYMNFPVKSIPYEKLENMVNGIKEIDYPFNHMQILSSNLSLYGMDLYGKQRSHEAINLLTSPECVKFVNLGCLINFYPELIREIIENHKIKIIFISLESGSERVYNLMNRPISLAKLVETIKYIKRYRPDIIINTELICGFPTETFDDLKRTIDLIQELDINPIFANPYIDSTQVPSSKYPKHSFKYNLESSLYARDMLFPLNQKFEQMINNGEMIVIAKYEDKKTYVVLLIDGEIKRVRFDQFDKVYNVNDVIPANTIISKQVAKKRTLQKQQLTR